MLSRVPFYLLAFFALPLAAAEWTADSAGALTEALRKAETGDKIKVASGEYKGRFIVSKPLTLEGEPGASLDAQGEGSCLTIKASGVRISGLELKNYGSDLYQLNSGVLISDGSQDIELTNLNISGPGFGVRADHSERIRIQDCRIQGEKRRYVLDRGDGVYFNYVRDAVLKNNVIRYTRDGFYFENTDRTQSSENDFAGLQYGIHYMYTRSDAAWHNQAQACIGGYALMSSEKIQLIDNQSAKTVEFGVLLNETDASVVSGNKIQSVKNPRGKPELDTEGKGIFIYGGGVNSVEDNSFSGCDIGVGVAMGGEGTVLNRNRIVNNRQQVRYVGTSSVEWTGNYWSNYQGWDLNRDGVGDIPFQPNDSLDRLFCLYPSVRFLMDSPLTAFLRFVTAKFEFDQGKGVVDSRPLMQDPVHHQKEAQ